MSELSAELDVTNDNRVICEPAYLSYMREHGYPVLSINEAHSVESGSRDKSHMVVEIATYDKPKDSPTLDVVADEISLWVCSCEDFTYNKAADVSEDMTKPSDSGRCKHVLSVDMTEKAKADASQTELGE